MWSNIETLALEHLSNLPEAEAKELLKALVVKFRGNAVPSVAPEGLIAHWDAACWPNPGGTGGIGWYLTDSEGAVVKEHYEGIAAPTTNNEAEWKGLLSLLTWLDESGATATRVFGDSDLIVKQVTGKYKCNAENLKPLAAEGKRLLGRLPNTTVEWVRRGKNEYADELSRKGHALVGGSSPY